MRIAAYCRVSTEKDEQQESLEHQKEFFSEYAEKNGGTLFRVYADEGKSGKSLKKRKEFNKLMEDAKYKLFDVVVVKDISRFARNTVDFLQSIRTLKAMGINTIFLTANMTSLGDSEFILTIFGAMAQEELSTLSKRVKWGKKINAQKGRVPQRIYGYDRIDNFTLQINPEEAMVVRDIFKMYIEDGLGCRTISMKLNAMGVKTKFQKEWNPRGVRRVLHNSIYAGHYVNHKYEIEDYLTGKQVRLPDDVNFHHERPEWAIVSEEIFQQAQEQLHLRREQYTHGDTTRDGRYSSKHIFSTLMKCEECGRSFTRRTYTYVNSHSYWKCPTNVQYTAETCPNAVSVPEDQLIEAVRAYLQNKIKDRDAFVASIVQEYGMRISEEAKDMPSKEELEANINKLQTKIARFQEMYANDLITLSALKQKLSPINKQIEDLSSSLSRYSSGELKLSVVEKNASKYADAIQQFLELKSFNNMDMRKVIDHITVSKDGRIRIYIKKIEDII